MHLKKSVFIALAIVAITSVAPAAETAWPKSSASELSMFVTVLRFRIYADHCSAKVPELKPKFAKVLQDLSSRVQDMSKDLLASDMFKDMKDKPVPAAIIDAFKDSFDDVRQNVERLDAASVCPKTLQNFGDIDDAALNSSLTEALTAVRNMIQKLEKQSVLLP